MKVKISVIYLRPYIHYFDAHNREYYFNNINFIDNNLVEMTYYNVSIGGRSGKTVQHVNDKLYYIFKFGR